MIEFLLWAIGFALCCIAGFEVNERVKKDPFSDFSPLLVAIAGFACFPLLNYLVAYVAFCMLNRKKS